MNACYIWINLILRESIFYPIFYFAFYHISWLCLLLQVESNIKSNTVNFNSILGI